MAIKLIIDGNAVYEIDEECAECQKKRKGAYFEEEKQARQQIAREESRGKRKS